MESQNLFQGLGALGEVLTTQIRLELCGKHIYEKQKKN